MAQTQKREFLKMVCQAVVIVKEGDKILHEETSTPTSCYSLEQVSDLWAKAEMEVNQLNVENRASRRSQK